MVGNVLGMIGMAVAIGAAIASVSDVLVWAVVVGIVPGGIIGLLLATVSGYV